MPPASALLAELPPRAGELTAEGIPERDALILDMLRAGYSPPYEWVQLVSAGPQGILRCLVGADALRIGDESDSVRVNLCGLAADIFAREQSCVLLTPKLNDLRWAAAAAKPTPTTIDPYPADQTSAMVEHSRRVDAKVGAIPENMARGNVGKGAVSSTLLWGPPKPAKMAIYGWHVTADAYKPAATPAGGRVIQPESTKHVDYFVDYSATVVLARSEVEFATDAGSGVLDIQQIASSPELCPLVSASGPVIMRHPRVACADPTGPFAEACGGTGGGGGLPTAGGAKLPTWALVGGGLALAGGIAWAALV